MAAAPPQSGQPDNSSGILWIVGATLVFAVIIWVVFKKAIVGFYFHLKLLEINLISHFTHNLDDTRTAIQSIDVSQVAFEDVMKIGEAVGYYLAIPFVILIVILAFVVYFAHSTRVFKRIYDMRSLAELEHPNWPQITPVIKLDLIKTDIDQGPWAMALTPMQFCKRHKLLEEHKRQPKEGMTRKEWSKIEVKLKRGQANKLFILQLGSLWQGTHKLPLHIRALFAAFAARFEGDTQVAADLLAQLSASSATKLDFSGVDELCKKYQDRKNVQKVVQSHAYVLTVMASMLDAARVDGVQASADFLWVKPIDRRVWYMLNTVGRQTPFVEVAGPFAHWIAEKEIGRRLLVPMVEEATNALELALKEIIYRPDENEGAK